jgi:hypothetical protein
MRIRNNMLETLTTTTPTTSLRRQVPSSDTTMPSSKRLAMESLSLRLFLLLIRDLTRNSRYSSVRCLARNLTLCRGAARLGKGRRHRPSRWIPVSDQGRRCRISQPLAGHPRLWPFTGNPCCIRAIRPRAHLLFSLISQAVLARLCTRGILLMVWAAVQRSPTSICRAMTHSSLCLRPGPRRRSPRPFIRASSISMLHSRVWPCDPRVFHPSEDHQSRPALCRVLGGRDLRSMDMARRRRRNRRFILSSISDCHHHRVLLGSLAFLRRYLHRD